MGTWMGAPQPWLHAVSPLPTYWARTHPAFYLICLIGSAATLSSWCCVCPPPLATGVQRRLGVEKVAQDPWVVTGGVVIWTQITGVRIRKSRLDS